MDWVGGWIGNFRGDRSMSRSKEVVGVEVGGLGVQVTAESTVQVQGTSPSD